MEDLKTLLNTCCTLWRGLGLPDRDIILEDKSKEIRKKICDLI
jgi:hypothetical protein